MRHHTAAQKGVGGGWHYVSLHKGRGGYPLGYCGGHAPHSTEQEARECYARYQRDHVRLDITFSDWSGCRMDGCDVPTKTAAGIQGDGFHMESLCAEHLTAENAYEVLGLNRPAGDAWVS